jgi:TolA-binding protein
VGAALLANTEKSLNFFSSIYLQLFLCCCVFFLACRGSTSTEKNLFYEGRTLAVQGRYYEALPVLEQYLSQFPNGRFSSRAGLFLGKCYMGLGQLEDARSAFADTRTRYPQSLEAHKSAYKIAVIAFLLGEEKEALRQFTELSRNPDGPLCSEATAFKNYLSRNR